MIDTFREHIEQDFPFLLGAKLLIAISGGIDSVVLTHLCNKLELKIALAHCNFNLRGNESDEDERFVRNLGNQLNITVFVENFDTQTYVEEHKMSTQMAARKLRYDWFEKLTKALMFDFVLTAHQADDNLETFLINLSRGTGLEGLTGIPPINKKTVRPLLPFSRDEILQYAKENNLKWREDSSNAETKYLRNKLRLDVIPKLKGINPTFLSNFQNTVGYLQGSSEILEKHIEAYKLALFTKEKDIYKVAVSQLVDLKPRKAYLYNLFKEFGFKEWNDLEDLLFAQSGKQVFSSTHKILKDRDYFYIQSLTENNVTEETFTISKDIPSISNPLSLTFEAVDGISDVSGEIIYVDKEKLIYPLMVRKWQKGDSFYPFGMSGKKKVAKYFKDEKYSLIDKENQWLLCSGDDIVWIIGKRADNRFKVEKSTQEILKIQLYI